MLMRHASAGLPLIRTNTGSGLRQPGLMALALRALTRMKGLIPRIFMVAVKPEAFIKSQTRTRTTVSVADLTNVSRLAELSFRFVHHHGATLHHPTQIVDSHVDVRERVAFDGDKVREITR